MPRYAGVRSSAFRHVFGEPAKSEDSFLGIKKATGNQISCNDTYFAVARGSGGGSLLINRLDNPGRPASWFDINVHKGHVLQAEFNPFASNLIATASADALIKLTEIPEQLHIDGKPKDTIREATRTFEGHYKKVDLLNWNPTASNVLASGSPDGTIKIWDVEAQAEFGDFNFELEEGSSPTCLNWNSTGSLVAVGSKADKKMIIFDPRNKSAAQQIDSGLKAADGTSYTFADNHNMIIGIGKSRQNKRRLVLWDTKKMDAPVTTEDLDSNAGVLFPMYDPDNSVIYLAGKGDANISYWELAPGSKGNVFSLSLFKDNKPHKKVAWVPKRALDVKKCEVARAMRLMEDKVVPVRFQVPRKSDLFQKDLYPDTYSGIPGCTVADWKEGTNGEIKTQSMKPGAEKETRAATSLKKVKSAAEYEAEIATLKAKVVELEAKLA